MTGVGLGMLMVTIPPVKTGASDVEDEAAEDEAEAETDDVRLAEADEEEDAEDEREEERAAKEEDRPVVVEDDWALLKVEVAGLSPVRNANPTLAGE